MPSLVSDAVAEMKVLGIVADRADCGLSIDPTVWDLDPSDFASEKNAEIFAAMTALSEAGQVPHCGAIHEKLVEWGNPTPGAMSAHLGECQLHKGNDDLLPHWSNTVRICAKKRRFSLGMREAAERAGDPGVTLDDAAGAIASEAREWLEDAGRKGGMETAGQVMARVFQHLEEVTTGKKQAAEPTGLTDLDARCGGMRPTEMIVLAARPSMGKTALALNILAHVARAGKHAVFVSGEMSADLIGARIISTIGQVSMDAVSGERRPREADWAKMARACDSEERSRLHIVEAPLWRVGQVRQAVRKAAQRYELGVVAVDYLQLLRPDDKSPDTPHREIAQVSNSLKAMANEIGCPVIALAQLSRKVDDRPAGERMPRLSDLRESGQIEQDADQVWGLYRPAYYDQQQNSARQEVEIGVLKNRNGAVGACTVQWEPATQTFRNIFRGNARAFA